MSMKTILHILAACAFAVTAHAGQSVFSADGKTIYLSPMDSGNSVYVIDAAMHKHQSVQLFKKDETTYVNGITRNPQGEIVFATNKSLWRWNGKDAAQKILDLPKDFTFSDISCVLSKGLTPIGTILLLGTKKDEDRNTLYALLPGSKEWGVIFCRRNEPFSAPQTNAAGRMFCASNLDLWECTIIIEPADAGSTMLGSMEGCRIAPLAMMNTDSANAGAMIVGEVVAAGEQIFSRLQGRHMGAILQTTAPAKPLYSNAEGNEHPELTAQYRIMKQSLTNTNSLYVGGPCDALSVHETSATEYRVFWRQDHEGERAWMLLQAGGKPQKIGAESRE